MQVELINIYYLKIIYAKIIAIMLKIAYNFERNHKESLLSWEVY